MQDLWVLVECCHLTLLHSEWPKLHRVLAIMSAIGLILKDSRQHIMKFTSANFQKMFFLAVYGDCKDQWSSSADQDKATHFEPPHLDLRCLQIQLLSVMTYSVSRLLTIMYSAMIDGVVAGIDVYSNTLSVSKVS